jgi:hypothetical protein
MKAPPAGAAGGAFITRIPGIETVANIVFVRYGWFGPED